MKFSSKKAFTMIELVFVIVVIGILAAIAVPKFAATRDDATITKAMATIGSVRSALAIERQKRILRGNFVAITSLNSTDATNAFDTFSDDEDGNMANVLEYAIGNCTALEKSKGCWSVSGLNSATYTYTMPTSGSVVFTLSNNRFDCNVTDGGTGSDCRMLTQ